MKSTCVGVLTFGGTISQQTSPGGAAVPGFSVSALSDAVGDLDVDLEFRAVADIGSKDIRPEHWCTAVRLIGDQLAIARNTWAGIVILHGTDTLHYTSAALSFMLGHLKLPVVLTGSMKPGGDRDSDSRANFRAAVQAACDPRLQGVVVVFSSTPDARRAAILQGTNVRKTHSIAVNAFTSFEVAPIGQVENDEVILKRNVPYRVPMPACSTLSEDVPIVKVSPGLHVSVLSAILDQSSGVVLEGTGVGHVPASFLPVLKQWAHPIVMTTQTASGGERLGLYEGDRSLLAIPHLIPARRMASETAQVKLMWALSCQPETVSELMSTNVCGELD